MAAQSFPDSLVKDTIQPGIQKLMESRYFSELREGKLSKKRLQGWAVQHYLHNIALLKGFALCMVKTAHQPDLFNYFHYQLDEETPHPNLAKKFGLALGLKGEDFQSAVPVFECLAHTAKTIHGMLLGSAAENRAAALVNEGMVGRYAIEFTTYLKKHYGLNDDALEFFVVHGEVDQEHTRIAAEIVGKNIASAHDEELARQSAQYMIQFKLAKFEGIYNAYA